MADVTVTLSRLLYNTSTGDILGAGAGAGSDHNTGETGSCDVSGDAVLPYMGGDGGLFLVLEEQDGSTASVVVDAGDYPPSMLKHKGSLTIALAANDALIVPLEPGRFLQNDGTITWTVTGGVRVKVCRLGYDQ